MSDELPPSPANAEIQPTAAADWLWRPWYAKLWWATIPIYWAGAAGSLKIPALAAFYDSVLAGYLNMLFFPPTALLGLGLGFASAWLEARPMYGDPLSDEEIDELERIKIEQEMLWDPPDHLRPVGDIYDPFSGTIYIGNPLSPNNGSRV
jgi:hypothetical protein